MYYDNISCGLKCHTPTADIQKYCCTFCGFNLHLIKLDHLDTNESGVIVSSEVFTFPPQTLKAGIVKPSTYCGVNFTVYAW